MNALRIVGWLFAAVSLVLGLALFFGREGGDAATRGLGRGLGTVVVLLALTAAALAFWGGREPGRGFAIVLACLVGAAPLVVLGLTLSPRGLALLYPDLRDSRPMQPVPQYRFRDRATRETALAIVYRDWERLDSLLSGSPAPSFTARDELGQTLLGIAAYMAVTLDATTRDVEIVERLLAMGARPQPDDLGRYDSLIERLAAAPGEYAPAVLDLLLTAGLDPNTAVMDGRSVLLYPFLQAEAARVLLAHGADRSPQGPDPDLGDWSPVTVAVGRRHWDTAVVLLAAGVPPDYANPPGSLLAEVIEGIESLLDDTDRADLGYRSFIVAAGR